MRGVFILIQILLVSCAVPDSSVKGNDNAPKIERKEKLNLVQNNVVTEDSISCYLDSIFKYQQLMQYRPMVIQRVLNSNQLKL